MAMCGGSAISRKSKNYVSNPCLPARMDDLTTHAVRFVFCELSPAYWAKQSLGAVLLGRNLFRLRLMHGTKRD